MEYNRNKQIIEIFETGRTPDTCLLKPEAVPGRTLEAFGIGRIKTLDTTEVTFSRYDTADYLETEEDIAAYLSAILEENDPSLLTAALGDIARARNMSQLARSVGMSREGLYKALSGTGNPAFSTISKVANALGLQIRMEPLATSRRQR